MLGTFHMYVYRWFPQVGSKVQLPQGMLPLLILNNANDPSTKFDIYLVYC